MTKKIYFIRRKNKLPHDSQVHPLEPEPEPGPDPIVMKSIDLELSNSQYLEILDASQTGLDFGNTMTISGWFKFHSLPSSNAANMVLFSKQTFFNSFISQNDQLNIFYSDGTNTQHRTTSAIITTPELDTWIFIAFTIKADTKEISIYKGTQSSQPSSLVITVVTNNAVSISDGANPFRIGATNTPSAFADFKIADPRIYNTIRTLSEIQSDYIYPLNGDETGLISTWRFNNDLLDSGSSSNDLSFAGSGSLTFGTDFPYMTDVITLNDFDDGRIFQRNGTSYNLTITGTYTGTTSGIEARIVEDGTSTEVVGWTSITTPSGGSFSGSLSVPQGGMYNVQVRKEDNTSVFRNGSNAWGIGSLIAFIGQSQAVRMFSQESSPPVPNSLLRMFNELGWQTCTGNGAIFIGNTLINNLSIPVGLLDYGVGGCALYYKARAASPNDFWWRDEAGHESNEWNAFISASTGLDSIGGSVEYIVWMQGEQDAISELVTSSEYDTGFSDFKLNQIVGEIANIPVIVTSLARTSNASNGTDASWQDIKDGQILIRDGISNILFVNLIDMPFAVGEQIHWDPSTGYQVAGGRIAQAILFDLGLVTFYKAPEIASFSIASTTSVTVSITHFGGTTFTPTSGLTGFIATDDSGDLPISTAVRTNGTTITLTFTRTINGTITLQYLYGQNPDVTSIVKDNSSLNLPLLYNSAITEI